ALRGFSGTILFVSHDRLFMDELATHVFEVRDHALRVYPGNYEDYLRHGENLRQQEKQAPLETRKEIQKKSPAGNLSSAPTPVMTSLSALPQEEKPFAASPVKRVNPIKKRQMEERCAELEENIPRLEAAMQTAEQGMAILSLPSRPRRCSANSTSCARIMRRRWPNGNLWRCNWKNRPHSLRIHRRVCDDT
ncbi:ABC transporter, ATP-binding protein, partial [mine drainage metagenome]